MLSTLQVIVEGESMADIFVSYSATDRRRIEPLVAVLQEQGWSVWWDRDLVAGPSFDEKIEEALESARCVVVAWSSNSVQSRWVRTEANEGLERGILVPLRIEEVRPPLAFRSSQTASLVDWPADSGELDKVISGIEECLGSPARPPEPKPSSRRNRTLKRWSVSLVAPTLLVAALLGWWGFPSFEIRSAPDRTISVSVPVVVGNNENPREVSGWLFTGMTRKIGQNRAFEVVNDGDARARYRLDSTILAEPNRTTVELRLLRNVDRSVVWLYSLDREHDPDSEVARNALAGTIGGAVRTAMSADLGCAIYGAKTTNRDAAEYYCQGLWEELQFDLGGEADWKVIRDNALKAIELDPDFAAAHAMLANYYGNQADTQIRPGGALEESRLEATRLARKHAYDAIRLDPDDPYAEEALGNVKLQLDLDYQGAEQRFQRAIALDPRSIWISFRYLQIARTHLYRGETNTALANFERARQIDDSWGQLHQLFAFALLVTGDFERAVERSNSCMELIQQGFDHSICRLYKVRALTALGHKDEAERELETVWSQLGQRMPFLMPGSLAAIGRTEEARKIMDAFRYRKDINAAPMVVGMLSIGDMDGAFRWLHQAIDDRNQALVEYIRVEPNTVFEPMWEDERWPGIIAHLETVEAESRAEGAEFESRVRHTHSS